MLCVSAFLVQSEEILTCVMWLRVCSWRSLQRFVRMRCLGACSVFVHFSRLRSCHSRVARALCSQLRVARVQCFLRAVD